MIDEVFAHNRAVTILDIGGLEKYWRILPASYLDERNVSITILNLPRTRLPEDHDRYRFVKGDGLDLSEFSDQSFDIAHANAVLQHVGDWDRMVRFGSELARVSRKYFVQTPNYWFPIEPHCMVPFFHWLPKPTRTWLVLHFQLGHWRRANSIDEAVRTVESARLLNRKMLNALFPDAVVVTERMFGLPKSLIAIKQ
jgi:ubiquinone/menaquinone biosynthesis C-methylase UbiE